jgi:hypothetical protein
MKNQAMTSVSSFVQMCSMLMLVNLQGNLPNGSIPSELGHLTTNT